MTIRIVRLILENFKGVKSAGYNFCGKNAVIYGRNGTGKSSVYDAWCWLMTGKDSQGKAPADNGGFAIKPLAPDGSVVDRAARTVVEAVVDAAGREIVLRREYYERWTEKRGSSELSYDGNSTDYYIDEVPKSKRQYEEAVSELIPLDTLRLLSDVTAFARLDDKRRREILFGLAGLGDEQTIMETDERFEPLLEATDRMSLADYQKQQQILRRKLNEQRSHIPSRIDEVKRSIAELAEIPFDELRRSVADLEHDREKLDAQLAGVGDRTGPIRLEISEQEKKRMALQLENDRYKADQRVQLPDTGALEREVSRLVVSFRYESRRYQDAQREKKRCENQTEHCREQWRELKAEQYPGDAICPTCGQQLPPEKQKAALEVWSEHQRRRIDQALEDGKRYKTLTDRAEADLETIKERMVKLENDIARAKDELESARAVKVPEIRDMPDYEERRAAIDAQLDKLRNQLWAAQEDHHKHTSALKATRDALTTEIRSLQEQIVKEDTLRRAKKREEELYQQTRDLSTQIADADRALDLIEQFTRYRASYVTDSINRRFKLAQFQLFRTQVNGGLVDCCDILYQGVPYNAGLNTGAKINVGLDIINTLSLHYGCSAPVFVDGAESVNELLLPEEAQCIRLTVSQSDEKVRMETE